MVAPLNAGDGQRAGDIGQRGRRPWSVSLPPPVSCRGEGGQVAGVLQFLKVGLSTQVFWRILPFAMDFRSAFGQVINIPGECREC